MSAQPTAPFYKNPVLYFTAGILGLLLVFVILISIYEPQATHELGLLRFVLLGLGIALLGWAIHTHHVRTLEKALYHPLQRLTDSTYAIAEGATSGRVELGPTTDSDVLLASDAVNKLAQKASRDIAEYTRLERVRSEFLGNVSHELRTPVFSVQGYLETLLDGAVDDPSVNRQFLEKAYHNTKRLNTLLNDLIDISRIESGELRLSFRYFDMCEVLKEVVQSMEHIASQHSIAIVLELPSDDNCSVLGDKERLVQVMTNLIDNALKYNTEHGTVTVSARVAKGTMHVSVSDTGVGIAADQLDRIFERFFRVGEDRSRSIGGSGLGLAIVKHILEAHQAPVHVSSVEGKGTTISFELKTA